jgi:hypothetical protein
MEEYSGNRSTQSIRASLYCTDEKEEGEVTGSDEESYSNSGTPSPIFGGAKGGYRSK